MTVELRRAGDAFVPVEDSPRAREFAALWVDAAARWAGEPDAVAIETRRGSVVFVRAGDRVLATTIGPRESVLAARYRLRHAA